MTALLAGAAVAVAAYLLSFVRLPRSARANYRGAAVSLVGAQLSLVLAVASWSRAAAVAVAGCGVAGWYDDAYGDARARGLRGHLAALRRGRVTTGLVKLVAVGATGLAVGALLHGVRPRALLDAVVVAGAANLLNLFDLRPGRALKVALVCAAALLLALPRVAAVAAGAAAGALPGDLRERTMLGDGGANALGALLGVACCAAPLPVVSLVAAVVVLLTLASERVSFSRVIDAAPPLRWADRLGRAA